MGGTVNDHELGFDRAHSARIYDYYLGGKDNYPRDQVAARAVMKTWPAVVANARANRAFMHRATHHLAAERGITQFLDIGTGIPTSPNLHEVAQAVTPSARIVYVDRDPIVLAHARALLTSCPEGATSYLQADLTDSDSIINSEQLRDTLDLTQPVSLSLIAIIHFVEDQDIALRVVRRLVSALPSGSYLSMSIATDEFDPESMTRVVSEYRKGGVPARARGKAEIDQFFEGLELVPPGVVPVHTWYPGATEAAPIEVGSQDHSPISMYGACAGKP